MWLLNNKKYSFLVVVNVIVITPTMVQFNSVYLPIKGPQGATGKFYMNKQYAQ